MKIVRAPDPDDFVELFEGELYTIAFLRAAVTHGFDSRHSLAEELQVRARAKQVYGAETIVFPMSGKTIDSRVAGDLTGFVGIGDAEK